MGTGNIPSASPNTVIPSTDHNSIRSAAIGDWIPRNASANAEDEAGNIGTSAYRWLIGFIKTVFIGESGDNISLYADNSDLVVSVGGNERARIPQSVELLPPGMIVAYSGESDPQEWLICDGRLVSRSTYARLYAAIGDTYGEGNGTTTFAIPDFRGRFLRGSDDMGTAEGAAGRDPDASSRTAMSTGGNDQERVGSIQGEQLKSHSHTHGATNTVNFGGEDYLAVGPSVGGQTVTITAFGGNETRPINANVNWIIKT